MNLYLSFVGYQNDFADGALAETATNGIDLRYGCNRPATMAVQPETADKIELVGLVSNIGVVSSAVVLRNKYPDVLTAFQMKTMDRI